MHEHFIQQLPISFDTAESGLREIDARLIKHNSKNVHVFQPDASTIPTLMAGTTQQWPRVSKTSGGCFFDYSGEKQMLLQKLFCGVAF